MTRTNNVLYKCQSCQTRDIMQIQVREEKIIKIWYDRQEQRMIVWFVVRETLREKGFNASASTRKPLEIVCKRFKHSLVYCYSRRILQMSSGNRHFLDFLTQLQGDTLLLFKKRQKLRKRKMKIPGKGNRPSNSRRKYIQTKSITNKINLNKNNKKYKI
ncbi:hypothetical protein DOY81_010294 [Sarcophaga bullata]|nr:hypothetical protein DOY81_010294 [Sarcophaga bullata]